MYSWICFLLFIKMAQDNFTLEIKIWDLWDIDTYSIQGYIRYGLIEIGNKLYLMEKNLDEL